MGAKFKFQGIEEYVAMLERLEKDTDVVCSKALYKGANVVTDAVRAAIENLPTVSSRTAVDSQKDSLPFAGITSPQKKGLLKGLGISRHENKANVYNVKVGFDGYNKVATKKYPKGQPNVLVARGLESGSSAKVKTPFIRPAVTKVRKQAEAAMVETAEKEFEKLMNESE